MSVTFYPAVMTKLSDGRDCFDFAVRTDERCGCAAFHDAKEAWVHAPEGTPYPQCDVCAERDAWSLHLSNRNAYDLAAWLGVPEDERLCGDLPAKELAARCRRRLWPEARNLDTAIPTTVDAEPGHATVIDVGRGDGYLRRRTEQLLALAERSMARFGAEVLFSWA